MITKQVCELAIANSLPTLEKLAATPYCRWSDAPYGLAIYILAKDLGLHEPYEYAMKELRLLSDWGKFMEIARRKADLTEKKGLPSSAVISQYRWLLMPNDILYGGAVITSAGNQKIIVATSGLKSETDEAAAKIVLANIELVCNIAVRGLLNLVGLNQINSVPSDFIGISTS